MKRYLLLILLFTFCLSSAAKAESYLLWHTSDVWPVKDVFVDSSGVIYASCSHKGIVSLAPGAGGDVSVLGEWHEPVNGRPTYSSEILIKGNTLIVANREAGTRFLDVSDPANPVLVATIPNPVSSSTSKSARLFIDGDMLYVSSVCGGFSRINIADVNNPVFLDNITFPIGPNSNTLYEAQGSSIFDGKAYVANPWGGWSIVDVSDMSKMEVLASISKPAGCSPGVWEVLVKDGIAYVLAQSFGVQIFDVRDTNNVQLLSEIPFPALGNFGPDAPPADIKFLFGNIAAISYGDHGVFIYDFSDSYAPKLLAQLFVEGMIALNMFVQGDELYVAGWTGGLYVFDISGFRQTPVPATLLLMFTGVSALIYKRKTTC